MLPENHSIDLSEAFLTSPTDPFTREFDADSPLWKLLVLNNDTVINKKGEGRKKWSKGGIRDHLSFNSHVSKLNILKAREVQ